MAEKLEPLDISQLAEVRRLAEEVRATSTPRALQIDHETVAILSPPNGDISNDDFGRTTSEDDPVWNIIGLCGGDGPGNVAENVDEYLAQAYTHTGK